jgi:membrane associated rhomboid family serine protease
MRQLCHVESEKERNALISFLWKNDIECQVYRDNEVWVFDENQLRKASILADAYFKNPAVVSEKKEELASITNDSTEPLATSVENTPQSKPRFVRPKFSDISTSQSAKKISSVLTASSIESSVWLTWVFVVACVLATYLPEVPSYAWIRPKLLFSEQYFSRGFPEIVAGEYWRLITPIFMHGGFIHILFNMMWLIQLGLQIEVIEGKRNLFFITIIFAVACNCAQYLVSGPNFLGYSGVVYGILSYIWMKVRYSKKYVYVLPESTVYFMIIWMLICLVGIIPGVANTQHVVGFLMGIAVGYLSAVLEK